MVGLNRWLVDTANLTNPPLTLLDTTDWATDDTVGHVAVWIRSRLGAFGTRKARNDDTKGTKEKRVPSSSRSIVDLE